MQRQIGNGTSAAKRCKKCGRPLSPGDTHPYGPVCHKMVEAAARVLEMSSRATERKAAKLLREGGLTPAVQTDHWIARGSDNNVLYFTSPDSCTCKAEEHDKLCYHRIAAIILSGRMPDGSKTANNGRNGRNQHEQQHLRDQRVRPY